MIPKKYLTKEADRFKPEQGFLFEVVATYSESFELAASDVVEIYVRDGNYWLIQADLETVELVAGSYLYLTIKQIEHIPV